MTYTNTVRMTSVWVLKWCSTIKMLHEDMFTIMSPGVRQISECNSGQLLNECHDKKCYKIFLDPGGGLEHYQNQTR